MIPERWLRRVRAGVWVVVASWLLLVPAARHIFGSDSPAANQWAMFVGYGLDVCVVEYSQVIDGKEHKLDRLATLGHDRWVDAPSSQKLLRSKNAVERQSRQICRALGDGAVVHLRGRCASRRGWMSRAWKGKTNICEGVRQQAPRRPLTEPMP
jgi:hypothetical protein